MPVSRQGQTVGWPGNERDHPNLLGMGDCVVAAGMVLGSSRATDRLCDLEKVTLRLWALGWLPVEAGLASLPHQGRGWAGGPGSVAGRGLAWPTCFKGSNHPEAVPGLLLPPAPCSL